MVGKEVAVTRPQRWDEPFDRRMRAIDVEYLLRLEPFCSIDPADFSATLSLDAILRNDARLVRCQSGDLVVREGDYGHSAFLILQGRVRVAVDRLDPEILGRPTNRPRGWWTTLWHTLRRPRLAEVRPLAPPSAIGANPAAPAIGHRSDPSGEFHTPVVFLMDVPRVLDSTRTAVLETGEIFGELAALTRSPRTATVFAEGDATLLEIRWQGLRDLMCQTDRIRTHVEAVYRRNSLLVHLRETPLLAELPPHELEAVARETQFLSHGQFDWNEAFDPHTPHRRGDAITTEPLIAEEGTRAPGVLLIRSGFARHSRRFGNGHRTLAYLGRGQAFGWREAIEAAAAGRPAIWTSSLRALGYVDTLLIPSATIAQHVLPLLPPEQITALDRRETRRTDRHAGASSDVPAANAEAIRPTDHARHGSGARPLAGAGLANDLPIDQSLLEFLVEGRFINGQQAMVIDLDRCTRCDDCVRACAATHHNNPRFVRQGPRHGPLQIAQACMHCVDPVCMIGCPTGAIGRSPADGTVQINDATCIGCAVCAQSCPYDNIRMVEIRDPQGAILIDELSQRPLAKATKCDLCADLSGGPACLNACPHDALVRLDLSSLPAVAEWTAAS